MRQVYAHRVTFAAVPGPAPVAAVTAALPDGHLVLPNGCELRILFATEPDRVAEIRERIDVALASGGWHPIESGCRRLDPAERPEARRLLRGAVPRSG